MNILNFLIYLWVTAITPGPNTITSMTFGNRYGFKRTLTFNFGIFSGMLSLALLAAFLGNALMTYLPNLKDTLKWFGIAYLLWLAWHIYKAGPLSENGTQAKASFSRAYLQQFINVKAILYCITSMTTFVLPHVENPLFIAFNALLLATIALLSSMVWSGFGSLFRKLFQDHYRLVNTILALLLVYCAWTLYH